MVGILTVLVFVSVAVMTAVLGWYLGSMRARAVKRLQPERVVNTPILPSPWVVWRELVARIGSLVPASSKDLPRLKRRLMRAGLRGQNASRYFNGARAITTIGLAGGALVWAMRTHSDNLFLAVAAMGALGYMLPMQYVMIRMRRRKHAIEKGLPNALDLLVVCVESGLGIDQAIMQVAKELNVAHPEICDEFAADEPGVAGGQAPRRGAAQPGGPHRRGGCEEAGGGAGADRPFRHQHRAQPARARRLFAGDGAAEGGGEGRRSWRSSWCFRSSFACCRRCL